MLSERKTNRKLCKIAVQASFSNYFESGKIQQLAGSNPSLAALFG
jgi:hypothetical protein